MKHLFQHIFVFCAMVLICSYTYAQTKDIQSLNKEVVQLYGVLTTEQNQPLPQASVFVEGTKRGTLTNERGIYSIVVSKGDKVRFSFIGFKDAIVSIPHTVVSATYNIDFKLVEDTTVLPTTFIRSLPSPAQFTRDFLAARADLTSFDIAQYNVRREVLLSMAANIPRDGREASSAQVVSQIPGVANFGRGAQTTNFLRPSSWNSFVKEWKEGGTSRN